VHEPPQCDRATQLATHSAIVMTTSDVVLNVNPLPLHSPPFSKGAHMHAPADHSRHILTRTRTRAHMCLQNAGQSSARQRRAFSWCALVSLKQVQRARACSTSAVKHGGCGPRGTNALSLEHCMARVSVQPLSRPPAAVVLQAESAAPCWECAMRAHLLRCMHNTSR
jgi:hypothetical protein